jgi:hypothetical protein
VTVGPTALRMNSGVPPTPRNARTGEFTPPGINSNARAKSSSDRFEWGLVDVMPLRLAINLECADLSALFVGCDLSQPLYTEFNARGRRQAAGEPKR